MPQVAAPASAEFLERGDAPEAHHLRHQFRRQDRVDGLIGGRIDVVAHDDPEGRLEVQSVSGRALVSRRASRAN